VLVVRPLPALCSNHAWVEKLFAPLIRDNFVSTVVMDVQQSSILVHHPLVDAIHMTGGVATHNMIVWGSPKAPAVDVPAQPLVSVPVTSELGAITPWIIVPAAWSDSELEHHAKYLATAMSNNASCNCNSPKLLVLPDAWPLCDKFLAAFEEAVSRLACPYPYYPGTNNRYEEFLKQHDTQFKRISSKIPAATRSLPWVIIELPFEQCMASPGSSAHPYALQHEPFAPIISVVRVKHHAAAASDFSEDLSLQLFLDNALEMVKQLLPFAIIWLIICQVNNHVMGTLSCTVIAHSSQLNSAALQRFVADLR
jgi:acyl-CoA reductase-like NAD-dependent aldehyde dehydrogenase